MAAHTIVKETKGNLSELGKNAITSNAAVGNNIRSKKQIELKRKTKESVRST